MIARRMGAGLALAVFVTGSVSGCASLTRTERGAIIGAATGGPLYAERVDDALAETGFGKPRS